MAVQLFKKEGGHIYVEPEALQRHLAQGYLLDDPVKIPKAHPLVFYPSRLKGIENLPAKEAEKAVLAEMGIIEIVHPVETRPAPIKVIGPAVPEPKPVRPAPKKPGRKKKA